MLSILFYKLQGTCGLGLSGARRPGFDSCESACVRTLWRCSTHPHVIDASHYWYV